MALCANEVAMRRSWELTPATRTTVTWTPRPVLARSSDDRFRKIVRDNFGADAIALRGDGSAQAEAALLTGHFARFGEWTEISSLIEGHFMEKVAPGAFAKTIRADGKKMRVLFNHGSDPTLGKQILGDIQTLREDAVGAYYAVRVFEGLPQLLRSGLTAGVYGSSFRFSVEREQYVTNAKRSSFNPKGLPERTILEARVYEFGPVSFPAYEGATSQLGGKPKPRSRRTSRTDWRLS
jgi:HK97 family phage prohead protease